MTTLPVPARRGRPRRGRLLAAAALTAAGLALGPVPAVQAAAPAACTPQTGPYQWQLEKRLGLPEDGRASVADCEAVAALQKQLKLKQTGKADLVTYRMALVDDVRKDPNARKKCPVRSYRVTCIDLTRQVLWVQAGKTGKLLFAPVPVRTGLPGFETRTGWQEIYWRHKDHFSTIYDNAPMPYSQFFNGGQALHGTYHDLFTSGSGGCVNLRVADAEKLWNLLEEGDHLYIYGKKPTTVRAAAAPMSEEDRLVSEYFGSFDIEPSVTPDTPVTPAF
ncbi:hypothetical protein SRB5_28890 [Streptomyces sp. RB5]|uniref:L,D-TPase catalytic domain-containing protein n=1 Tax=Streptomyces smaragdinus TaxID=2585196 RepID=A0A7K0CGZ7_9ACTN|nr:L,D-transpeptidase [Streptomyces smaragdinus]MQY12750.1 hypothetical protein [Streptomyces smaragdinus]